jgi:hypothetical protein
MPIAIDGSGTITGISAGGLPDSSITAAELASGAVTQVKLASGVAGSGPAFGATDAATTATANVSTKIIFDTELFDTDSAFDGTTFQPTLAGYYYVSMRTANSGTASATTVAAQIYKNGALYVAASAFAAAGFGSAPSPSCIVYLNGTTDYLEFYGINTVNANLGASWAFACLVRAA